MPARTTTSVSIHLSANLKVLNKACSTATVNRIVDFYGNELRFDRVTYRPTLGFPLANELVTDVSSGTNCCIACQTTVSAAINHFAK